jgi:hypothetical protein
MILTLVIATLVGAGLVGAVVYFWPQIMSWAREHLLPWVERNVPELAESVRLAFADLDKVAVGLRRAVRAAWRRLRTMLLSQTAQFFGLVNGEWAIRITSYLRNLDKRDKRDVRMVTEERLEWEDLPEEIRAEAMSNGINGTTIDITKARDQLLEETA